MTLSTDSKQLIIGHRTPTGTVIDRTYAMAVSSGTDYTLGVTLRGGLVNASINGAVVASAVFNETITIGGYGFISMKGASSGTTSFDNLRLRTDDVAYAAPAAPLVAAAAPAAAQTGGTVAAPSDADLSAIVAEAKARWRAAGLDAGALARMDTVTIRFADLDGLTLGQEELGDAVLLDLDAAGYGWFIDRTPGDDNEFQASGNVLVATTGPAAGHMDLLTVVAHELGHAAGLEHTASGLMADQLAAGTREVRAVVGHAARHDAHSDVDGEISMLADGWSSVSGLRSDVSEGSPVGDLSVKKVAAGSWFTAPASGAKAKWMDDFVNHAGRTEIQRNPNAALRLQVPVAVTIAPRLSALDRA